MRTVKTMISLGGCPGWTVSSLGTHAILLVMSLGGSNLTMKHFLWGNWWCLATCHLLRKTGSEVHFHTPYSHPAEQNEKKKWYANVVNSEVYSCTPDRNFHVFDWGMEPLSYTGWFKKTQMWYTPVTFIRNVQVSSDVILPQIYNQLEVIFRPKLVTSTSTRSQFLCFRST